MLALKDCIDMCGLTEDEVVAIAEEENLPPIVAVLIGSNLLRSENGLAYLGEILRNRAEKAVDRGEPEVAAKHRTTYENFRQRCPQPLVD
ncbi:hypothetical protein [Dechloromonas sp. H13]|uniref:hypothetical protein n=1 Tax=Dechloromonas sp. H13 TaxID=2570193 RepID=UPI0012911AEE|nr:hypothetical protein [Dechloromonas sp. H13]